MLGFLGPCDPVFYHLGRDFELSRYPNWSLDFSLSFDPWTALPQPWAPSPFPKVPRLDEVSPYCLLLCLSYMLGSSSVLYTENLQFCSLKAFNFVTPQKKCSIPGAEICSLFGASQAHAPGQGRPLGSQRQYCWWNWVLQWVLTFCVPAFKKSRKQNKVYTRKST